MISTGYLVGRVRSRSVFSEEERQRFLAALSFADLEKLLLEAYCETRRTLQVPQLTPFLWYKYDAHNLKLVLREKLTGLAQRQLLLPLGSLPVELLITIVAGQKPELGVWNFVYELSAKSEAEVARTIDAFYYAQCLAQSTESGLRNFASCLIDIANIKKCITREGLYISGGSRPIHWWQSQEYFTLLLRELLHAEPAEEDLEQFLDEWLFVRLRPYRYVSRGVMPLLLFFLELELEMKNIKIKYLAKQKQFAELQELVRKAYV